MNFAGHITDDYGPIFHRRTTYGVSSFLMTRSPYSSMVKRNYPFSTIYHDHASVTQCTKHHQHRSLLPAKCSCHCKDELMLGIAVHLRRLSLHADDVGLLADGLYSSFFLRTEDFDEALVELRLILLEA